MKILLAVSRFPWPPRRGDQLRAHQFLRALSREHDLVLVAPRPADEALIPQLRATLPQRARPIEIVLYRRSLARQVLGLLQAWRRRLPLQTGWSSVAEVTAALRAAAPGCDLAILQLVRLGASLHGLEGVPVILDLIDSLALNFERRAAFDRSWKRPLWRREARLLRRFEHDLVARVRLSLLVCERDRADLVAGLEPEHSEKVAVLPVAVDAASAVTAGGRPIVAFTGNLGYFVNADAVCSFCDTVWSGFRRLLPEAQLVVAGARPPAVVRRAVVRAGGRLIANPEDLGSLLCKATVSIAPMRAGSGVPIKVLEAWAAGIPVVATPWAAAGVAGHHEEDLLIADSASEWQSALARLLQESSLQDRLRAAGRKRWEKEFSREAVESILLETVDRFRH